MAERFGERLRDRLGSGAAPALRRRLSRGVASASDSGMISSTTPAKISNVVCQPKRRSSATASGENRNWPNEPAAVPAPNASDRHAPA